jgi:hypothetical protein
MFTPEEPTVGWPRGKGGDDSRVTEKVTGGFRGRGEATFWKDAIDFLQIWNWKAEGRGRGGCRKEIGEAMTRKRAEAP